MDDTAAGRFGLPDNYADSQPLTSIFQMILEMCMAHDVLTNPT
jgi:hypothetical protein